MGQERSAENRLACSATMKAPLSKISHVDLVVSSIARSLPFYRGLLEPIGWTDLRQAGGEQGETIYYLSVEAPGLAALGLREKRSAGHDVPYDRDSVGVHHLCLDVPSREVADERALSDQHALEGLPQQLNTSGGPAGVAAECVPHRRQRHFDPPPGWSAHTGSSIWMKPNSA
jgi:catechol 2,3-dioxygenase-like lactoylglutathione lyase family enzyme